MNKLPAKIEKTKLTTIQKAHQIEIHNQGDLGAAAEIVKGIKNLIAEIQKVFNPIVDAAHKAHLEATSARNQALNPLRDAEVIIKSKIATFHQVEQARLALEERERQEQQRKLDDQYQSRMDKAKRPERVIPPQILAPVAPMAKAAGVSIREGWGFEVVDTMKLPPKYWVRIVDTGSIQRDIDQAKGKIEIPGVRIFSKDTVAVKA